MKPLQHIVLTIGLYLALRNYIDLRLNVLLASLIITLMVDFYDHGQYLLMNKNRYKDTIKHIIKDKGIFEAYHYYRDNRAKIFKKPQLHTPFFMVFSIILTVILESYALLIGLVFHFFCDILDYYLIAEIRKR